MAYGPPFCFSWNLNGQYKIWTADFGLRNEYKIWTEVQNVDHGLRTGYKTQIKV